MNDNNISATKKSFVPDLNQRPMDTTPPTVHRSELSKDTHYNASGELSNLWKYFSYDKTKKSFEPDLNQRPMDTYIPLQSTALPTELSKDTHDNASGEIIYGAAIKII